MFVGGVTASGLVVGGTEEGCVDGVPHPASPLAATMSSIGRTILILPTMAHSHTG